MVGKIFRYIFIVAAIAVAVSVVLERRAFRSMLPQEYNFLERLGELEIFSNESKPVSHIAVEQYEPMQEAVESTTPEVEQNEE
ncbi:MAG: hypothetical protein SNI45_03560 [Rikenellaceae bacterium]